MNNTFRATKKIFLISFGILALCFSAQSQDTLTEIVSFDLRRQPQEASGRAYEIGLSPNVISSAALPALPEGATVIDVQFLFPSLKTMGNSFGTDVLFGFSGAVSAGYSYGDHAPESAAQFNFYCLYDNSSVAVSGGRVNLHYYDVVNDNTGAETIFNTGKDVATLLIRYTVAPRLESDEVRSEYFVAPDLPVENQSPNIQIYPNPSNGQIFISMVSETAVAAVFDMQGKLILENKIQNGKMLDITDVNPGVYTIRIAAENALTISRIVKL